MHKNGQVAIVETKGNKDCHVILRGGKAPNYDAAHVAAACKEIEAAKLDCTLMVDCSHANSSKQHERQVDVARDVAAQMKAGSRCIFGVMVESHLVAGAQKFSAGKDDPAKLAYGQSITDACLGWDDSLECSAGAERGGAGAAGGLIGLLKNRSHAKQLKLPCIPNDFVRAGAWSKPACGSDSRRSSRPTRSGFRG